MVNTTIGALRGIIKSVEVSEGMDPLVAGGIAIGVFAVVVTGLSILKCHLTNGRAETIPVRVLNRQPPTDSPPRMMVAEDIAPS